MKVTDYKMMSTAMATGNRRKQKHSNLWMNMDDFSTLSLSQSSSSSSSPSSDMTLPTPPRSPNASMGFDETMQEYSEEEDYTEEGNGIPEPLLDDLLELWCEEADFPADGDANEEISIHNALTELGFDTLVSNDGQNDNSMSETERAETMIDHLLATCKASYLSPPPTNPSSPKMQTDSEFEETFMVSSVKSEFPESIGEEIEEEIVTDESEPYQVKMEGVCPESILPHDDSQGQEVIQSLIDCSDGLMNYEIDDHLLDNMDKFDEFASANFPAIVAETSINAAKSVEKLLDNLKSEPKDEPVSFEDCMEDEEYDWFGEPQTKKGRYDLDDEFLTGFPDIKQDCMWNGFLGADSQISAPVYDDRHLKDSSAKTTPRKVIQGIIVKSDTTVDKVGGAAPKKTKILVPLKDLMETLQQKSFLVSPLGPNKKIIRFTGSDSVKGVLSTASFQSAAIVAGQCSSGSRTISSVPSKPNHNVRKRPHTLKTPKIEITSAMSPMEMSPSSSPLLSSASSSLSSSSASSSCSTNSGSNSLSTNPTTKKKTKAHNNMERMRRIDLRNSFENLKKLVPPLAKIPKCSKVEILRRAEEYIKGLRNQEKRLQKEEMAVRQRNAQLRSRLENTSSSLTSTSSMLSCN
ncbi:Myc protein [Orchesella cincta]|uniref:Myc protein n=1 Tax=Orchesella cincta TaxID=48709 RepID=A0A1D2MYR2_ORCCI|nr:Myc protein [Orchesella cincta]